MKKLLSGAVLFLFTVASGYSQGEIDEQQKALFRNERTFGILLSTDGYGLSYREGLNVNARSKKLYEIDIAILNHPREVRLQNPWYQNGATFVFGKLNSVFLLRGGIGRQYELFRKEDLGGVAIRYFFTAGPDLAFLKPIYYKVLYPLSSTTFTLKEELFEESIHHPGDIYSKSSFTKGINETKVVPGIYIKGGFNFEYSRQDKVIHAFELGPMLNIFPKEIPIMASNDNKALFFSLFVSYRMGLIIDPYDPESNKISTIFIRKR
ncbi:MAG: hypothetical protein IH591_12120 [Bacteroidales bacterium]|nr:hypothetical protein [Bacteroidales bacterium]